MVAKTRRQLAKLALLLLALLLLLAAILLCVFLIPRHHRRPLPPASQPGNASNPDDSIVAFDFSPYLIMYKSGRVHRLDGTARCSAGVDEATGVTSKDVVLDSRTGLAARMYLPPAHGGTKSKDSGRHPVLVFYHGGAFVIESAFTPLYHAYLNGVAAKARVVAVSMEYRLAPEHRLPTAYDDSWQALNWVARNAASGPEPWLRDRGNLSRLFVAGDSAGANIAHNMAMRAGGTETEGVGGWTAARPSRGSCSWTLTSGGRSWWPGIADCWLRGGDDLVMASTVNLGMAAHHTSGIVRKAACRLQCAKDATGW
ncbi:probable carboxylesterase 13 isoform X2 [Miscanthus floridulus]|uniref:probable carboxylesterase 13 isoform X2 n=1 Tax=Miscanthus floridulus TaxID=154761 RepID=UPI0034574766